MYSDEPQPIFVLPCTDPDCDGGTILVYDAYSDDPLQGKPQPCDVCNGVGFLIVDNSTAVAE